ncbi:unnamed protein product [Sphagnum jensenii]|uniref:Uncharacterized protein n=1 Tax=Sphagnum jensenii TaxID=128206 RepID=A0ABP0XII8_9BRYO
MVHGFSTVLGMDSIRILADVHPSLVSSTPGQTKNISNVTIEGLAQTIHSLEEEKRVRLQKLRELRAKLLELWNLMDTPIEEQQLLQHITSHITATQDKITIPGALSSDTIAQFASKGAHLNLKCAERARAAINKLPSIFHMPLSVINNIKEKMFLEFWDYGGNVNLEDIGLGG